MVIRSFMAHHQGMSFLTIANLLSPTPIYERFHRNKQVRATELLLQERIPKRARLIKHPSMTEVHVPTPNKNKLLSLLGNIVLQIPLHRGQYSIEWFIYNGCNQ